MRTVADPVTALSTIRTGDNVIKVKQTSSSSDYLRSLPPNTIPPISQPVQYFFLKF